MVDPHIEADVVARTFTASRDVDLLRDVADYYELHPELANLCSVSYEYHGEDEEASLIVVSLTEPTVTDTEVDDFGIERRPLVLDPADIERAKMYKAELETRTEPLWRGWRRELPSIALAGLAGALGSVFVSWLLR